MRTHCERTIIVAALLCAASSLGQPRIMISPPPSSPQASTLPATAPWPPRFLAPCACRAAREHERMLAGPFGPRYAESTHRALTQIALERSMSGLASTNQSSRAFGHLSLSRLAQRENRQMPWTDQTWCDYMFERAGQGAEDEDALPRFVNHFYNPLTNGRLTDIDLPFGLIPRTDSLSWAWFTDGPVRMTNYFSWQWAKGHLIAAITSDSYAACLSELDQLYFTLGHTMHLVEDAAQPQHTRNDSHAGPPLEGQFSAHYEYYCAHWYSDPNVIRARIPGVDTEPIPIFDPLARVWGGSIPSGFRSLWDTDQLGAGGTLSNGMRWPLGIAEISNAFFVTDDTMFSAERSLYCFSSSGLPARFVRVDDSIESDASYEYHRFMLPCLSNTTASSLLKPDALTRYGNIGDVQIAGEPVEPLFAPVRPSRLCSLDRRGHLNIDLATHEAYAQVLLPKAVAYSAAMVNYLFRAFDRVHHIDVIPGDPDTIEYKCPPGVYLGPGAWTNYIWENGRPVRVYAGPTMSYLLPGETIRLPCPRLAPNHDRWGVCVFRGLVDDEENGIAASFWYARK